MKTRATIALALLFLGAKGVHAQEKSLPLAPPSELLIGSSGDRQMAVVEKFGQISVHEVALAKKVEAEDSTIETVRQHSKIYDFYLVPLKFGVLGFDGKTCKYLQIGATLKAYNAEPQQAFVLSVFPLTSLKKGSMEGDGKVTVSSDLKVEVAGNTPVKGNVGVGGEASLKWHWSPLYQYVTSVYDQSRVLWRFDAVAEQFPVGEIDVGAVVAIAKEYGRAGRPRIAFDVEVRASFGGGWFDAGGLASVVTPIVVRLP